MAGDCSEACDGPDTRVSDGEVGSIRNPPHSMVTCTALVCPGGNLVMWPGTDPLRKSLGRASRNATMTRVSMTPPYLQRRATSAARGS